MPRPVRILAFGDNVVDCYRGENLMFPGGNCVNHAVFAAARGRRRLMPAQSATMMRDALSATH